jgi:hypothetical protein
VATYPVKKAPAPAAKQGAKPAEAAEYDAKALQKECLDRLGKARQRKQYVVQDLMEGYFFTNPRRSREMQSQYSQNRNSVPDDVAELQTTVGMDASQDFAGLVVNTFMPANFPWVKRGQGPLTDEQWEKIEEKVTADDNLVLSTLRASNFDAVAYQSFEPDLSIGVVAIWIDEDEIFKTPTCRSIPLRKLEIDLGPDGQIGPRFVCDQVAGRDIAATLGSLASKIPAEVARKIKAKPDQRLELVHALWRKWENKGTEEWCYTVLVDKTFVHHERLLGEGSCPLIVTPWSPTPDSPWGDGPALRALPYLRVLDSLSGLVQDRADQAGNPSFAYPNDGVLNFEGGIQSGMAYPMAAGTTKNEFVPLYFEGDVNTTLISWQDLESAVKRLWFVDRPEQLGKTPPTAAQWLDQLVDMQKRIGLVGQRFWRDGPLNYFNRFKWILTRQGKIQPLKDGLGHLQPYNPAVKGQEYQEVQTAVKLLEIVMNFGGVQGQALIDAPKTFANIKKKLGDQIVEFNDAKALGDLIGKLIPQADINIANNAGRTQ